MREWDILASSIAMPDFINVVVIGNDRFSRLTGWMLVAPALDPDDDIEIKWPTRIHVDELDQTFALERMRGVNASLLGDVVGRLSPPQCYRARRALLEIIART
ncbi:hypothetical protein JYT71_01200 [Acidimicrobiaceae bacterium AH-315-P05]|nr:hypothetical protein [Acidimicrobiaceae bacterium AH-315-P05]